MPDDQAQIPADRPPPRVGPVLHGPDLQGSRRPPAL